MRRKRDAKLSFEIFMLFSSIIRRSNVFVSGQNLFTKTSMFESIFAKKTLGYFKCLSSIEIAWF